MRRLDPQRQVAILADGDEMPFDLFLGVPVHRVPAVVAESGMCVDGWIPVDPLTLETAFPDVYAVGDVTSVGTPKAGVFAEGQAAVVADAVIAGHGGPAGHRPTTAGEPATSSSVTTGSPWSRSPSCGASARTVSSRAVRAVAADKAEFGASRVRRWFGRDWASYGPQIGRAPTRSSVWSWPASSSRGDGGPVTSG